MTHAQAVDKHASERYLLGEMPELERFAFEEHYFSCAECAEDVRIGELMREGVHAGLLPAASASSPAVSASWRVALPWAVAAMLALAVGYQSMWTVPELRSRVLEPQVLAPITLRAATRGAEPLVTRPAAGVLSFAIDLGGIPAGATLAYDLRAADGSSVASGTAVAPSPGVPLLVLVPVSAVRVAGSHTLSVRSGQGAEGTTDYRFSIAEH